MQKDEVIEFLEKIDRHMIKNQDLFPRGAKFDFKIIGKSALLLAGLIDTAGTVDIDSLGLEAKTSDMVAQNTIDLLLKEFGRPRQMINGYYLEFVSPAIVFLAQKPTWIALDREYSNMSVHYLEPRDVIASKFFSAFALTPRKKDKQDVVAAFDQRIANFQATLNLADDLFDFYSMDSRADRFPDVHAYITQELMSKYGKAHLKYDPNLE
jgi:hypothetical protein